jgi:hypothetical protein
MPWFCENSRYRTNAKKGCSHTPAPELGSVFDSPIASGGDHTLWLEHVIEPKTGAETYWLMWYDKTGHPTIKESAVFSRSDIQELSRKIASFIEVP